MTLHERRARRVGIAGLAAIAAGCLAGCAVSSGSARQASAGPTVGGFSAVTVEERAGIPTQIAVGAVGYGMQRVYVMRRAAARDRQPLIIFFHGYGTATVAGQEPWLTHMADRATLAWPVYDQPPFDGTTGATKMFPAAAAGLRTALSRLRATGLIASGDLVVAGYSLGGGLAADYAAAAPRFGLPRPRALYLVFPGRGLCHGRVRLPPQPGEIGPGTRILALASPNDLLAGTCTARAIVRAAVEVPASRKQLRLVRDYWVGDHFAPTRTGPQEQATFWRPLDRILAEIPRP